MKLAVLSDIHANREALTAVLADTCRFGVAGCVSLGDVIGFNGDPAYCIETIRPLLEAAVRGNHEAALLQRGLFGVPVYTAMMDCTAASLLPGQREWIAGLPDTAVFGGIRLAHATPAVQTGWQRIATSADARCAFSAFTEHLCLFGHTHRPAVFCMQEGEVRQLPVHYDDDGTCRVSLSAEKRYLINPGSVGQPRDMDPRAAYAVIDTETQELLLRRITYDTAAAAAKISRMGLPESFAAALMRGSSPTGD